MCPRLFHHQQAEALQPMSRMVFVITLFLYIHHVCNRYGIAVNALFFLKRSEQNYLCASAIIIKLMAANSSADQIFNLSHHHID
jgi:hypothetical protein